MNRIIEAPVLTAADRCDACNAQAFVRVALVSGNLFFCAHHARKHMPKLKKVALSIVDETGQLAQ
ncbi:DUF7455 domain-containing protein [Trueperella bialowiezensis]|uniref:DUF7455 domain-containing protein n=1 Tax=Trueperella bialowiezensis TaxID=312285 RepID=UPI000F8450C7|nr:hypothetical protein [Trueperella bialowiezensis]